MNDLGPMTFAKLHSLIAFGASRFNLESVAEQVAKMRGEFTETIDRHNRENKGTVDELKRRAEEIMNLLQGGAASLAASQQAIHFAEEAKNHMAMAKRWLIGTIVCAVALFFLAGGFLAIGELRTTKVGIDWLGEYKAPSTGESIQFAFNRVILFAALSYLVFLCSRNYFAHRHNATVNNHRRNALLTFQAIVKAAGADDKRDIILTKAAECIFSAAPTAYVKSASAEGGAHSIVTLAPAETAKVAREGN